MSFQGWGPRISQGTARPLTLAAALLLAPLLLSLHASKGWSEEQTKDFCVECHGQESFMVTNKKLYQYFQRWSSSLHCREGVTCVDCHGGDPGSPDKEKAHRGDLNAAQAKSAVNFRNIPRTCGRCHEHIYEGFRQSAHFEHVVIKGDQDQGPTCVTCHGSLDVTVLNVNTVEAACRNCHNDETGISPESPRQARALLRNFLLIRRYYHYIEERGTPAETKPFLEHVDVQLRDLALTWHTFDLDSVGEKIDAVLPELVAKREEIASAHKKEREDRLRSLE